MTRAQEHAKKYTEARPTHSERYVAGTVRAQSSLAPLSDLVVELLELPPGASVGDPAADWCSLGSSRTGSDGRFSVALDDVVPAATARRRVVAAIYRDNGDGNGAAHRPLAVTRARLEPITGEDLLVHIPDAVLQEHGIEPMPPVLAAPKSQGQLAAARLRLAEATQRSLREATSPELRRRLELRRRGSALGRRLLAKKGRSEARRAYVAPGEPAAEHLALARADGISRLADMNPPGRTLRLDEASVRRLFPQDVPTAPVPVPVDLFDQLDVLFPTSAGASRLVDLLTACRAERIAAALNESAGHGGAGTPPHGTQPDGTQPDGRQPDGTLPDGTTARLTASSAAASNGKGRPQLLQELAAVLAGRPGTEIGSRPGVDAIGQDLATNLPPGPADTTAFYDFHRLQVAWQDTWTSAMDGMTVAAVSELYESLVETVDPDAFPSTVDDSEIEELEDLLQDVADAISVSAGVPGLSAPAELLTWFPGVAGSWTSLSPDDQEWIRFLQYVDEVAYPVVRVLFLLLPPSPGVTLADLPIITGSSDTEWPDDWYAAVVVLDVYADADWGLHQAETFLESIEPDDEAPPPSGLTRLERVLGGLNERLAEPFQFDIFVPNSYNFGVLTTYRQRWQPLEYQVGDLVASLPLSPGETRSFETKRVVKTSRTQKEIEHSTASRTGESTTTGRVESEIVQKASHATNFAMAAEGSLAIEIVEVSASNSFGANQAADSADTKRNVRESTVRAAQEYRDERTLEVATEESVVGETVEKRTISNPNNELTVTYLLYELQRRFEVAEQLHAIRPVVLVAFDVPSPDEITEGWLIANAWIIRRVILDDRLVPALDYLSEGFAGDELGVEIQRAQWDAQMRAVDALRDNLETSAAVRDVARAALVAAASSVAGRDGLIKNLGEALFPSKADEDEIITAQRESAQQGLEWADTDLLAQRTRLEVSVSALQQATDTYVQALKERTNRRVAIDQLRVHVKDNILHYMQAIWSHEPTDQRYFRLYDLPIQWPETDQAGYSISFLDPARLVDTADDPQVISNGNWTPPDPPAPVTAGTLLDLNWTATLYVPSPTLGPERPLHEVADVDSLLGFKGNYAMFPLREGNAITDYMAQAFLDSYFGVNDPDPFGKVPTTTQAMALAECAWDREGTTDADRAEITEWLLAVMAAQGRISEEIIVPTGQLFMEALPGAHPLLEDFKLRHRALDLERAAVDVKVRQVELLRRAARLMKGDLADPDIEQRIEVSGAPAEIAVDVPPVATEPV